MDLSVVRREVNSDLLILSLDPWLESCCVVGRDGIVWTYRSMIGNNINVFSLRASIPFRYCWEGRYFPDIFNTLFNTCLIGGPVGCVEPYYVHGWCFFRLKGRQAFACDLPKADIEFPLSLFLYCVGVCFPGRAWPSELSEMKSIYLDFGEGHMIITEKIPLSLSFSKSQLCNSWFPWANK